MTIKIMGVLIEPYIARNPETSNAFWQRGLIFYEVRIFNQKRKTKKILSSKVLSKRYWNAFHENSRNTKSPEKMGAKKEHELNNEKDRVRNQNFRTIGHG